jgi:hypothetical protein
MGFAGTMAFRTRSGSITHIEHLVLAFSGCNAIATTSAGALLLTRGVYVDCTTATQFER